MCSKALCASGPLTCFPRLRPAVLLVPFSIVSPPHQHICLYTSNRKQAKSLSMAGRKRGGHTPPSVAEISWPSISGSSSHQIKMPRSFSGSGLCISAPEETSEHKTTSLEKQRRMEYCYAGEGEARKSIRTQLQSSLFQRNYFYLTYKSNLSPGRKR